MIPCSRPGFREILESRPFTRARVALGGRRPLEPRGLAGRCQRQQARRGDTTPGTRGADTSPRLGSKRAADSGLHGRPMGDTPEVFSWLRVGGERRTRTRPWARGAPSQRLGRAVVIGRPPAPTLWRLGVAGSHEAGLTAPTWGGGSGWRSLLPALRTPLEEHTRKFSHPTLPSRGHQLAGGSGSFTSGWEGTHPGRRGARAGVPSNVGRLLRSGRGVHRPTPSALTLAEASAPRRRLRGRRSSQAPRGTREQ